MGQIPYIFNQLVSFLPKDYFDRLVNLTTQQAIAIRSSRSRRDVGGGSFSYVYVGFVGGEGTIRQGIA